MLMVIRQHPALDARTQNSKRVKGRVPANVEFQVARDFIDERHDGQMWHARKPQRSGKLFGSRGRDWLVGGSGGLWEVESHSAR